MTPVRPNIFDDPTVRYLLSCINNRWELRLAANVYVCVSENNLALTVVVGTAILFCYSIARLEAFKKNGGEIV